MSCVKEYLEINNLTRTFDGVKALDDVSFSVEEKTITGLIGPNGAGKTTLFNVISGFLKPDCGKIYYNSFDITAEHPYKIVQLGIGRLWQDVRVFPKLTVRENVLVSRLNQPGENPLVSFFLSKRVKETERENLENAQKWIEFVELKEEINKYAQDLSYGEQKLLALTRLLSGNSNLLLLDEPATGIHPKMLSKIHFLLKSLLNLGKTIIIIEHSIRFVMEISDMILLMDDGKIVASGTPEDLINSPIMKKIYIGV